VIIYVYIYIPALGPAMSASDALVLFQWNNLKQNKKVLPYFIPL